MRRRFLWAGDLKRVHFCKQAPYHLRMDDFGLCQASPQAWSLKHWLKVMRQAGFVVKSFPLLGSVVSDPPASPPSTNPTSSLKQRLLRLRLSCFSSFYRFGIHACSRQTGHTKNGFRNIARMVSTSRPGSLCCKKSKLRMVLTLHRYMRVTKGPAAQITDVGRDKG